MQRNPRIAADDHIRGYESLDLRIGPMLVALVVLAILLSLVLVWMKSAARSLDREAREGAHAIHPLAAASEVPPEPRLQEAPALDLERFRAREEEILGGYGWVDRPSGVVRIPIDRAMELVAKEGLPVRKESAR